MITARQLQWQFLEELRQNMEPTQLPNTDTIMYWLDKATEQTVENVYTQLNVRQLGNEQDQKTIDDLRSILETYIYPLVEINNTTSPKTVDLPDDYLHLYRILLKISINNCPVKTVSPTRVQLDDLNKILDDPFNSPYYTKGVLYYIEDNQIKFYTPQRTEIRSVEIQYLQRPRKLTLHEVPIDPLVPFEDKQFQENEYTNTSELTPSLTRRALDLAVRLYMASTSDPRYQAEVNESRTE